MENRKTQKSYGSRELRAGENLEDYFKDFRYKPTKFFRLDWVHTAISESVVPYVVSRKKKRLKIWSAGCSTGQEAYSACVTALKSLARLGEKPAEWQIGVFGTDVSGGSVDQAAGGSYPLTANSRDLVNRYPDFFEKDDENLFVRPSVKKLVRFKVADLFSQAIRNCDCVLCLHLMMYYADEERSRLSKILAASLCPGGFLIANGVPDYMLEQAGLARAGHRGTYQKRS